MKKFVEIDFNLIPDDIFNEKHEFYWIHSDRRFEPFVIGEGSVTFDSFVKTLILSLNKESSFLYYRNIEEPKKTNHEEIMSYPLDEFSKKGSFDFSNVKAINILNLIETIFNKSYRFYHVDVIRKLESDFDIKFYEDGKS